MPREINRLTTKTVAALREPGFYADGAGLYLRIDQTLGRRWVLVYFWQKKRREMGLGSAQTVDLKDARVAARAAKRQVEDGVDPIASRKVETAAAVLFSTLAETVIASSSPAWKHAKTEQQWRASLKTHAPDIWSKAVPEICTEDVLKALKPIWHAHPVMAKRVQARIAHILDVAKIKEMRAGENPARWDGHLKLLLGKSAVTPRHHAALPYSAVPGFMAQLALRDDIAALALSFTILTACRTGEVFGAKWSEIDGDVWTIPAERMKAAREHRVPLVPEAAAVLDKMRRLRNASDLVFPGRQRIEPLSSSAMAMLVRRMGLEVTVHGFRSSFRDWAGDCTEYPREIAEMALAHSVGDDVELAYRRGDALKRRRGLMEAWATFCTATNVVRLRA